MKWNSTRLARCAAGLGFVLFSGSAVAAEGLTLNFDPDWKFIKADPPGASAAQFDDSGWTSVGLPHTYNDIDTSTTGRHPATSAR